MRTLTLNSPVSRRLLSDEVFQRLRDSIVRGELAPGDFVRTMKSVADLAQQVSFTAADPGVAAAAREAVDALVRGVVAGGLPGA